MEETNSSKWVVPIFAVLGLAIVAKHWWFSNDKEDDQKQDDDQIIGGIEMGGTNIKL